MALNITLEEAEGEEFRRRLLAIHKHAKAIEQQMVKLKSDAIALRTEVQSHAAADATDVQVVTDELAARKADLMATAQGL